MKNSKFETLLYSTLGVALMAVTIVGLNIILGAAKQRMDLTEGNINTLSPGTKKILQALDTQVTIRFYATRDARAMPVQLKNYAREVEDLLSAIKAEAGGNIVIEKLDPVPDSDAEESAQLDGVRPNTLNLTDEVYLGISVSMLDKKEALPFLVPSRQRLLEYDVARAISQVTAVEKPTIGVMTALGVAGQAPNPMMMQMGQQGGQPAWVFYDELQRDFEVQSIDVGAESIDENVDVLMLIHPKDLSEATQYAIDQFILRGGKLIAFIDPMCLMDNSAAMMNPMQRATQNGSSLTRFTEAWGLTIEDKVVADMNFVSQVNQGGGRPSAAPAVLSVTTDGIDADDVVTSQIDSLVMAFAGGIEGDAAEGLEKAVLVHSTDQSQLVEKMMAQFSGQQLVNDFKASDKEYALAVRLTGKFTSVFPDGKPAAEAEEGEGDNEAESADSGNHLSEGAENGVVVVVSDADLLADQFSVQVRNLLGNRLVMPLNGNLNLVQGLVEQMAGDSNLIEVRGRATLNRPFTKVKEMQAVAEENFRAKIKSLEDELQDAQRRLNDLQRNKDESQRFILSDEQQKELENFRTREREVKKELRDVRKQLRRDIDGLQTRLTWLNIAGMPVVITFLGIFMAIVKSKRTSAR